MEALIIGLDENGHDELVRLAFVAGGGVTSEWRELIEGSLSQNDYDYATDNGFEAIIFSYEGESGNFSNANVNPNIMVFMPSDDYTGDLQQLVLTDLDPSTDDYEFLDNTQSLVSYSNGYICGQLFSIASQRNCSLQEARICANATKDEDGIIDVDSAVAYSGTLQLTIGSISAERTTGFSVSVTLEGVIDATAYKIYRNGILLATQSDLTYTDTLPDYGKYEYRYFAYNDNLESQLSSITTIKYPRIDYLVIR